MNGSTQNASWWLPPAESPLLSEASVQASIEPALTGTDGQRLIHKLSDQFFSVKFPYLLYFIDINIVYLILFLLS